MISAPPQSASSTRPPLKTHRFGFCARLSQFLNPKIFLICNRYSPARRSFVIRWIKTVTSGTGGFMPFSRRNSNGSETFARRFVQYGLILRYSIFFVPAMICASHSRSIVVVIRWKRHSTAICHNFPHAGATDCRGGRRSSRNTSAVPLGMMTGTRATISHPSSKSW
jgi:hypothetical protein